MLKIYVDFGYMFIINKECSLTSDLKQKTAPSCFFRNSRVNILITSSCVISLTFDTCFLPQLEAMGFDRATVLEVYFACNKNEELAANYLLDHMHEFDE